jgi:hypothetical protein
MSKKALFMAILALAGTMAAGQDKKPALAILEVAAIGTEESKSGIVYGYLVDMVRQSDRFIVVERSQLDSALRELELSESGLVDDATAVEIGKMTGASAVLVSSITEEDGSFYLSMRIVDIASSRVIGTAATRAASFADVERLTRAAVERLLGDAGKRLTFEIETGFGLVLPLGTLAEVLGPSYAPFFAPGLSFNRDWGSFSFGALTGVNITSTKQDAPAAYWLFSFPLSVQAGIRTRTDQVLLLLARVASGVSVTILGYPDMPDSDPLVSTTFSASALLGAGVNINYGFGIYAFASFIWIDFTNEPYIGLAPGIAVRIAP